MQYINKEVRRRVIIRSTTPKDLSNFFDVRKAEVEKAIKTKLEDSEDSEDSEDKKYQFLTITNLNGALIGIATIKEFVNGVSLSSISIVNEAMNRRYGYESVDQVVKIFGEKGQSIQLNSDVHVIRRYIETKGDRLPHFVRIA